MWTQSAFGLELGELMSQAGTGILGPIRHRIPTNEQAALFLQGRTQKYSEKEENFHETKIFVLIFLAVNRKNLINCKNSFENKKCTRLMYLLHNT